MPSLRYDPGIERALRDLNRISGAETRSSCQGKSRPGERSTHSDLAYVLFRNPIPLALEERLLESLGKIARIDALSVYSRWPERNPEFCSRLAETALAFIAARARERWRESGVRLASLVGRIERLLQAPSPTVLGWCFDCDVLVPETPPTAPAHRSSCRVLALLQGSEARSLGLFRRFLEADAHPPDSRLVEREGDAAIRTRVERGDFGAAYRRAWRRHLSRAAREALRAEVRDAVAAGRARGLAIDYYFRSGKAAFARREE